VLRIAPGGILGRIPYYPSYTTEELRVAVQTAHGLGRLTTAHCRAKGSMTEPLVRQGTFVSYTFQAGGYDSLVELRAKRERERLMPAETARLDALESYFEAKLGIFDRLLRDGMRPRLPISSDAGPFTASSAGSGTGSSWPSRPA
jgi:hypothetical protein